MKKLFTKSNKGYSLVELIIVLAIIITLAVMSLVSLTLINSARAKSASVDFGAEVNALKSKCMNMKPVGDNYSNYGLSIYKDNSGTYNMCLVQYNTSTHKYEYIDSENVKFSSRVEIKLLSPSNTSDTNTFAVYHDDGTHEDYHGADYEVPIGKKFGSTGNKAVIITFDKRGNCYSGAGNFRFHKKNGTYMARVTIKQNGSIDIR